MFEQTLKQSPLILHISNHMKGGDFMGLENEASLMIWEGSPVQPVDDPISKNSSFPERKGIIRPQPQTKFDTALELSRTTDPNRPIDWSVFSSVGEMDAVSDRRPIDE